jgi:hypothetical protein
METIHKKLVLYLLDGGPGVSAKAMIRGFEGFDQNDSSVPYDRGDFGRCFDLLESFPGYRKQMGKLKKISVQWSRLVDRWDEIENLHKSDYDRSIYSSNNWMNDPINKILKEIRS